MMQNEGIDFYALHIIEMIAFERGGLSKYRRRNGEFYKFLISG